MERADFVIAVVRRAVAAAEHVPATDVLVALGTALDDVLRAEDVGDLEVHWDIIDADIAAAVEFREMLTRRRRFVADPDRMLGAVEKQFLALCAAVFEALPHIASNDDAADEDAFGVALVELVSDPAAFVHQLLLFAYSDETMRLDIFRKLRAEFSQNILIASGFRPDADIRQVEEKLKMPDHPQMARRSARELADLYLCDTPLAELVNLPIPFHIPEEARFEHCHIVGGTGHGKTQLMQRMIYADLVRATRERRSVVVIDSQGDLINKLTRLDLFDPDREDSLADRLVVIDPADVEFPAALNLFDVHLERAKGYSPVDRERVLNGVIELYEVFFGAMLGAELTQKQGVIFRYLARLMLTIPDATIHTLMQLMEDGRPFKPYMEQLQGSARYFFETEFFHPSFAATKKQILKRLWGVLSTPAFERMFAQRENKLDLFEALNDGKIILISTAKDLLKQDGSALFGRFFIAMLAQAALERSALPARKRTPTFVYVDEAQEYFDDSIETILNQARKYRVGLTLAHQTLDQLSPRLRSALHANTSFKCVGGVSSKDARALADELRTTSEFIEGMRRRGERTEFAVWLKQLTPHAIRLSVPLGFLERQPLLTEEAFAEVMDANRERYCGTLADVVGFELPVKPEPAAPRESPVVSTARESDTKPSTRPIEVAPQAKVEPPPAPREEALSTAKLPRRQPSASKELGKGGPQHRYIQHLIKGLAEERGFRAVIEEPVGTGQIDVALHRSDVSIACEISVTSTPTSEARNLAKCLAGPFSRVFAVATDAKRLKAVEAAARAAIDEVQLARIDFLTPEMLTEALDAIAPPVEESTVHGYRVKVSRTPVGISEAKDRRATVARVIAQSIRNLDSP